MGISKKTAGAYLGYTQGGGSDQKPTLYFENGRLTQEHSKPKNVGWHPLPEGNHCMVNADSENIIEIKGDFSGLNDNSLREHVNEIVKKYPSSPNGLTDLTELHLVEFCITSDTISNRHKSRGKFITVDDEDFNENYDEDYAFEQLESAELAENET